MIFLFLVIFTNPLKEFIREDIRSKQQPAAASYLVDQRDDQRPAILDPLYGPAKAHYPTMDRYHRQPHCEHCEERL